MLSESPLMVRKWAVENLPMDLVKPEASHPESNYRRIALPERKSPIPATPARMIPGSTMGAGLFQWLCKPPMSAPRKYAIQLMAGSHGSGRDPDEEGAAIPTKRVTAAVSVPVTKTVATPGILRCCTAALCIPIATEAHSTRAVICTSPEKPMVAAAARHNAPAARRAKFTRRDHSRPGSCVSHAPTTAPIMNPSNASAEGSAPAMPVRARASARTTELPVIFAGKAPA